MDDYHASFGIKVQGTDGRDVDHYEVEAWYSDDWGLVEICIEGRDGAVLTTAAAQQATLAASYMGTRLDAAQRSREQPEIEIKDELPPDRPWLIKKPIRRVPVELHQLSLFD